MTKISLPPITSTPDAKAHGFPIQIAFQTQEFIQGAMFYYSFQNIASGEFVRSNPGVIDRKMIEQGFNKPALDQAWKILEKYFDVFRTTVFQNVLVSFCSHWDWHSRKLSEFIATHHAVAVGQILTERQLKEIRRIDRYAIPQQLAMIEQICNMQIGLSIDQRALLREMSLVRNLGLHNRWEVDSYYLEKSSCKKYQVNHLREFDVDELRTWHQALLNTVQLTGLEIAIKFKNAPTQ